MKCAPNWSFDYLVSVFTYHKTCFIWLICIRCPLQLFPLLKFWLKVLTFKTLGFWNKGLTQMSRITIPRLQFSFYHSVLESFQLSFLVDIPLMHSMMGNLIDWKGEAEVNCRYWVNFISFWYKIFLPLFVPAPIRITVLIPLFKHVLSVDKPEN